MGVMPSEVSFWSWSIRGLGGAVNLLEGMLEHGPRLSVAQHEELRQIANRIYDFVEEARDRVQDYGGEFHQPESDRLATGRPTVSAARYTSADTDRGDSGASAAGSDHTASANASAGGAGY